MSGITPIRPNGFEVVSRDGKRKVSIRCGDENVEDWMDSITRFFTKHVGDEVYILYHVCVTKVTLHFRISAHLIDGTLQQQYS